MKTGFTLGKFAPFHKGHEDLIETALQEMDHVIAIVYNASEVTDVPTHVRANWIKQIFPSVEVIIAEDGPQDTGYSDEIIQKQNNYLNQLLKGKQLDAFYSGEKYGAYVSDFFHCENRVVDIDRTKVQTSGTLIRQGHYSRRVLSKNVFDSVKPRVYFLGGPSTGKSTLSLFCSQKLNGAYCKEYGRDYWFENQENHRLTMTDLEIIAEEQALLEDDVSKGDEDYLFIDTTTITTLSYAYYYWGYASPVLENIVKQNLYKYKNIYLCSDDIPFDDTWDRSGPASRNEIQEINKQMLNRFGLSYKELFGSVEDRYSIVAQDLKRWKLCGVY